MDKEKLKKIKQMIAKPPTFLNAGAKKKYYEIAYALTENGDWRSGDEVALSALCTNYMHWVESEKIINEKKTLTFETATGYRQQIPEVSISKDAMKNMLSYIKEFGLTPKARANIKGILSNTIGTDPEMEDMIAK
ncbi:phage terminase small subunit P27 family [Clostridium tyrobutyricum]|uniref:phage terminase small subunit P27 family n=1 Tax=Clostridium tyrobutyricum TaxID=1519 RepID=UPI001C384FBE|nr:phage terminase small subunit P27 family [Clostridium tyrobutyricum]MBV4417460.1 phage terminase small subunit P27 family [Clostridium tyrobutyricum]